MTFSTRIPLPGRPLFAVLLALSVSACTSGKFGNDNIFSGIDTVEPVKNADLSAKQTRPTRPGGNLLTGQNGNGSGSRTIRYDGSSGEGLDPNRPVFSQGASGRTFDLNLENTDIKAAAKVIFGDILNAGYAVDPRVQGNVSLSTGRPIPVEHVLVYFENALRFSNAAIVEDPLGYKIIPLPDATLSPSIDSGGSSSVTAGYGISIVPLKHVSAQSIIPLIDNFVTRQGLVKTDTDRNSLLVQGTAAERRAAVEAILSFDQEWLSQQSVGIYRVQSTNPKIVIREVEAILQTQEGKRGAGLVQMVPMDRLNGVMIVAKNKSLLSKTLSWMERLDKNDLTTAGIRVYQVQYAEATKVAATLNSILLGGRSSGASSVADARSQFPPDSVSQPTGGDQPTFGGGTNGNGEGQEQTTPGFSSNGGNNSGSGGPVTATSGEGALLENVRISADPANNTILVFADANKYKVIERAIAALDRRPQQVAIETTIAEITLNNELRHGVQHFLRFGDDKGSSSLTQSAARAATGALIDRILPGFNILLGPEDDPRAIIDALRDITEVNVLSQPSVVVRDNSVATLQIGDEVPITTQSARSVEDPEAPIVNSIDFRDTGVILSVRPRISANGVIGLDIKQEISSVVENASSETLTPTISQRKVESSLSVVSGQTVLLGGLISQSENNSSSGIPVLGDLNFLGDLFTKKRRKVDRTELILLIRPRVISNDHDASQVATELRDRLRLLERRDRTTPLRVPGKSIIQ